MHHSPLTIQKHTICIFDFFLHNSPCIFLFHLTTFQRALHTVQMYTTASAAGSVHCDQCMLSLNIVDCLVTEKTSILQQGQCCVRLSEACSALAQAAAKFRQFWGEKAELRRFQDGNITEAVVWEVGPAERHTVVDR